MSRMHYPLSRRALLAQTLVMPMLAVPSWAMATPPPAATGAGIAWVSGGLVTAWNTTLQVDPHASLMADSAWQYPLGRQEYLDLPALLSLIRRDGLTRWHSVLDSANHCLALALVRQCSGRVLMEQVGSHHPQHHPQHHQQAWHRLTAEWPVLGR